MNKEDEEKKIFYKRLSKNSSKVLLNFVVFVIIQTIFFYAVVSEFVVTVIQDKTDSLSNIFINNLNQTELNIIRNDLKRDIDENNERIKKINEERNEYNQKFLFNKMIWLLLGGILLFAITVGYSWDTINSVDKYVYLFIAFSYITELFIYLIVFKRHEFIGTLEIVKIINKKLPKMPNTMFL